jgi:four helix bundle protein
MKDFRTLQVWRKAHELTLAVYRASADFPADERFGLTDQVRRACGSIGANIAEGCGRQGNRDFARFLQVAMGSATEAEYHLLLSRDLGFVRKDEHAALAARAAEVQRMLASLIRTVRATS